MELENNSFKESDLSIIKVTGFKSEYKLDINIPTPDDSEFPIK